MDWILSHLQLILAIAGAIAYWLNARNKEKSGEPADYDGDGLPDNQPQSGRALREQDPTLLHDENTRRIQEEIRRKIAERQGGGAVRPAVSPATLAPAAPVARETSAERMPTTPIPVARRRELAPSPYAMDESRRATVEREAAAVLENQRVLAEQLAALKLRRAEAGSTARSLREGTDELTAAGAAGLREASEEVSLLSELRNARSLRKAIVLREVLGTPVGLR